MFGPTGPFREVIEEYLRTTNTYRAGTLHSVKTSLSQFFGHVYTKEGITTLDDITPLVVTRFIAGERARGKASGNAIGHVSTFFKRQMAEERFDKRSPVIPYIHSQKVKPAHARPYMEKDLTFIWDLIAASENVMLMLAFSIGEECGLRIGEVCNIRLEDIDQEKQTVFVRLPTKNMRTRIVPYHDKVARYLALWLERRDPNCQHDHLLHSKHLAFFVQGTLSTRFRKLLSSKPVPASEFAFHRLRHTWATRLMNNGMELAVLKELGGWEAWNSMQRYIRVLETTVRSQYEAAYRQLQERPDEAPEETLSFMDFALRDHSIHSTHASPAI